MSGTKPTTKRINTPMQRTDPIRGEATGLRCSRIPGQCSQVYSERACPRSCVRVSDSSMARLTPCISRSTVLTKQTLSRRQAQPLWLRRAAPRSLTALIGSPLACCWSRGLGGDIPNRTPADRKEGKIRTAIPRDSDRLQTAPARVRRTATSPGVRSAARLGRWHSGLRWPTHALFALRASEGRRAIAPSVTLS